MPQTPHSERHFTGSATVRDIVIGMSDGLTVQKCPIHSVIFQKLKPWHAVAGSAGRITGEA